MKFDIFIFLGAMYYCVYSSSDGMSFLFGVMAAIYLYRIVKRCNNKEEKADKTVR